MCRISPVLMLLIILCGANGRSLAFDLPRKLECYSTVFEPFVIEREGRIEGVDVDIIKLVGAELGIDISFALMPWSRLEQELQQAQVQCVAAYFRTEEREKYMHFTHVPLHMTAYTLFVKSGRTAANTRFSDIRDWNIGVNRGFKTTPEFEDAIKRGRIRRIDLNSTEQGFSMLKLGRLDAVLTNYHVGKFVIKHQFPGEFIALRPSIRSTPAYFVFVKKPGYDKLVPLFDEALFRIMIDGRYQEVFNRYMR